MTVDQRKRVVVVGLGMVGIAFIEKLLKYDARSRVYDIVVIGEEPHVAYNRVGLTSFFGHREVEQLYLNPLTWYEGIEDGALKYHLNSKVDQINSADKTVTCASGDIVPYDILVLATGSDALLPKHTPGHDAAGVFVYRNIDDLERLIEFAETRKDTIGAVVGGGLLGLEAAKAMLDLERFKQVKVIERNRWVLSRQLDEDAGGMVVQSVRELGVDVMLGKRVGSIDTDETNSVVGARFEDGEYMACSTICFAIGVRPRDELARKNGIKCADRGGGIIVADDLSTSEEGIYAIGECASWQAQTFGLIAPGVEMADVLAFNLTQAEQHTARTYKRPDLSTKLKLLGVEVASFGDFFADRDGPKYLPAKVKRAQKMQPDETGKPSIEVRTLTNGLPPAPVKALTYKDPFSNVYKKYLFTMDGKYLLGGMMIGDTKDYVKLVPMVKGQKELDIPPSQLILGASKEGEEGDDLPDDTQICSCHNVTKGDVANAVKDGSCTSIGEVKACTKAGTGCGGCMPLVTSIYNKAMKDMGNEVKNNLCAHFDHSRAELYHIVMVKRLRNLAEVMREAGNDKDSIGCEACKPAVAGILAGLWNGHVMAPAAHGLQDTNDRFLGNIQRDGSFSVVPRVSGGEINPNWLIVMGQVAKDFNLYTKITGGQRIDMFGAKKQDLPAIWGRLIAAGMETGHAYAKSLRTVKSCVGSTWCRYGIGDSVGLAVRLEERYKGLRAPHKIKGGVSGCVRECAEAQSKDFGLIATEKGFNVYVAGNGGANPRHAEILARDVPPVEVVALLDRYLMFYIRTADKLQRTARWVENLPGGIEYLRKVVVEDSLGINASLEAQMQELVDAYFDEWAEALADPAMKTQFRKFVDAPPTPPTTPPTDSCDGDEVVCHDGDEKVIDITEASEALAVSRITEVEQDGEIEHEFERGQRRPAHWAKDPATDDFAGLSSRWSSTSWQPVAESSHFAGADNLPNGISARIKRGDTQLAVFRVRGKYYCTQQMCPHKRAFVLSDGLLGDGGSGSPWVSCPNHKRNFDLSKGSCSNDSELSIATFECEERADGLVYVLLPPVEELDAALGTKKWKVKVGESGESQLAELDKKLNFVGMRAKKPGVKPRIGVPYQKRSEPVKLMMEGGGCGSVPEW